MLYYRSGGRLLAADVGRGPRDAVIGMARLLFSGRFQINAGQGLPSYAITADGSRFLMIRLTDEPPAKISVVLNWQEDLKQRVP